MQILSLGLGLAGKQKQARHATIGISDTLAGETIKIRSGPCYNYVCGDLGDCSIIALECEIVYAILPCLV